MTDVLELEREPIEIDPRPCELCGCTIDQHEMIDHGEGPEFFCVDLSGDEMTLPELERRADLRLQEETAAIISRWEAMDVEIAARRDLPVPYRPAQSTIDAFWYVVALDDADHLVRWLDQHPLDAQVLYKLWEDKNAGA